MNFNGYETKTTFWEDFTIADWFGKSAIRDTWERSKEWLCNVEYFTELVMVLNWKCWEHYDKGNEELSKLYADIFYKAQNMAYKNFKGEDLNYFLSTTD